MSFLRRHNKLVSTVTKREYDLPAVDPDGSKTRAITSQLLADNRQVTDAAAARNQRPLGARERVTGVVTVPDSRSIRERIAADAALNSQAGAPNPDTNPWGLSLDAAEAQAKRALLPADKAIAQRRLDMVRAKHAAWQQSRDAAKAAEAMAADPRLQAAMLDAEAQLGALALRPDVAESDVARARQRVQHLANGGTVADYWLMSATHNAEMQAARDAHADALAAQAKGLRAQAAAVRRDEPPAPE